MNKKNAFYDYLKANKMLLISMDPGYDAYKIYVNGHNFSTKSLSVKVMESDTFEDEVPSISDGAVIQMRNYSNGKILTYLMGQDAREFLATTLPDSADVSGLYEDASRFASPQFQASFYGALIRALWEYAQIDNEVGFTNDDLSELDSWKLCMMVTLPYAYAKEAKEKVQNFLRMPIDAKIHLSANFSLELNSPIKFAYLAFHPQVLAAFRGLFIDECGDYISETEVANLKNTLPALIIDAGYHTCAIVSVSKLLMTSDGNSIDEEIFSMEQFDIETANRLRQLYTSARIPDSDLEPALINEYCNGTRTLYATNPNAFGNEEVDVTKIREAVLNDEKTKLISYLNRKFAMGKMVSAYITGGTGKSVMYEYLSGILKSWRNIKNVTLLEGRDFDGNSVGSVYGVAYGGYVILANLVRSNIADIK